jgi:hypothetical protein
MGFWKNLFKEVNDPHRMFENTTRDVVKSILTKEQIAHIIKYERAYASDVCILDNFECGTHNGTVRLIILPNRSIRLVFVKNTDYDGWLADHFIYGNGDRFEYSRYIVNDIEACRIINENIEKVKEAIKDVAKKIDASIVQKQLDEKHRAIYEEEKERKKEAQLAEFEKCLTKLRNKL